MGQRGIWTTGQQDKGTKGQKGQKDKGPQGQKGKEKKRTKLFYNQNSQKYL